MEVETDQGIQIQDLAEWREQQKSQRFVLCPRCGEEDFELVDWFRTKGRLCRNCGLARGQS